MKIIEFGFRDLESLQIVSVNGLPMVQNLVNVRKKLEVKAMSNIITALNDSYFKPEWLNIIKRCIDSKGFISIESIDDCKKDLVNIFSEISVKYSSVPQKNAGKF